jgi:homoserine O-acetyltransferase
MHVHDLHEGRFGLTHEMFYRQLRADDLGVANALIHMDGTKIMGRWDDLTGEPHALSGNGTILRYSQEYRGYFGHISLVGIDRFIMPMIAGAAHTPFAPDTLGIRHVEGAHAQGGIAGFVHPYNHAVATPQDAGRSFIPVVAAVANVESYDVASVASREVDSVAVYYRLLNAGIKLAATGGTDNFSDVWFDPSGGATRTYARLPAGESLSYESWLAAVAAGRTFASSGPLLYLEAGGRQPGDTIQLAGHNSDAIDVRIRVKSIALLDNAELIVNGKAVQRWDIGGGNADHEHEFTTSVELPRGGWIAARVAGPSSRYVADANAFAHTSPVHVTRGGESYTSAKDTAFLRSAGDVLWRRAVERDSWFTDEQRDKFKASVDQARAYYSRVILSRPDDAYLQARAPETFRVDMQTTRGPVVIEVHRAWSPIGVDRFYNLVRNGYYDDSYFFRVRDKDFVQFGVHGDPEIATAWRKQRIADDPVVESNRRGTIGFAHGEEADDRTTQLYLNLKDKPELDAIDFPVFGTVVSGMAAVDKIYSAYGEEAGGGIRRGQQDVLFEGGNAWLNENFPQLDAIITATVKEE